MATANVTINGALRDVVAPAGIIDAQVVVALCGGASQVPRVPNVHTFGNLTSQSVLADNNGLFHFSIWSNDLIEPEGTYYTFTYMNANGDIMQTDAYRFIGPGAYDTSNLIPYDPNQPPPPLPPLVGNQLQIVPWSADPDFDGSIYTAWQITLAGDTEGAFLTNLFPGNLYTFIIQQDSIGNHVFDWPFSTSPTGPGRAFNGCTINMEPNSITIQTFVCDSVGNLYAIAGGTYWP